MMKIIFKETIKPLSFKKCSVCKKCIWPWQKRVLIIVTFPEKVKIFRRCIKCHKIKMKKLK